MKFIIFHFVPSSVVTTKMCTLALEWADIWCKVPIPGQCHEKVINLRFYDPWINSDMALKKDFLWKFEITLKFRIISRYRALSSFILTPNPLASDILFDYLLILQTRLHVHYIIHLLLEESLWPRELAKMSWINSLYPYTLRLLDNLQLSVSGIFAYTIDSQSLMFIKTRQGKQVDLTKNVRS